MAEGGRTTRSQAELGGRGLERGACRGLLCNALCAAAVMMVVLVVKGRTRPQAESVGGGGLGREA